MNFLHNNTTVGIMIEKEFEVDNASRNLLITSDFSHFV